MINFGRTLMTPVVKNLLIINGIVFLATIVLKNTFGWNIIDTFGLSYFESENFRFWQIITHIFLHGSPMHLFSNMFALWIFGTAIESYLGSQRFLRYYLLTGIGAALIHSLVLYYEFQGTENAFDRFSNQPTPAHMQDIIDRYSDVAPPEQFDGFMKEFRNNPNDFDHILTAKRIVNEYDQEFVRQNVVTVGASGAVFGVLLAFGMLFPNTLILIWFVFPMKAKYLVILYGLFELYNGANNIPGDNIAHFAHLGGMLIGFILLKIWRIKRPFDFRI